MNQEVQEYIDQASDARKELMEQLIALAMDTYPDIPLGKWWGVIRFEKKPGWVAFGYRKDGVSIYTCGEHHLALFKANNPKLKTGKGCINFRLKDVIPVEDVRQVIRHALEEG